jgi:putative transposase
MQRHAGAARWAFNFALEMKVAAHQRWRADVEALIAGGVPEADARKQVKAPFPKVKDIAAYWRTVRGDSRGGDAAAQTGRSPWWHEVSSYAISTGMRNAETAWSNWLKSFKKQRKGARVGYPRFKARHRSRDSFTIYHDVRKPTIPIADYRHLQIPRLGLVRVHNAGRRIGAGKGQQRLGSTKRLVRMIERGEATLKSVTVSRGGTRWYASVLLEITEAGMRQRESVTRKHQGAPKQLQRTRPEIGVEWGVRTLATLSDGTTFANPRYGKRNERRLRRASQNLSRKPYARGTPSSANRQKAVDRLRKVHHQTAEARTSGLHQLSVRIAVNYPWVAMRELNVKSMTKSARGSQEEPGRLVKVKARFNRAILDAAPYELRRQIEYKCDAFGASFGLAPGDLRSSQDCSECGWRDPSIPLEQVIFRCGNDECGLVLDRELNSARNIRNHAVVAPDGGETLNACGEDIRRPGDRSQSSMKQEDWPPPDGQPSRGSDSPALLASPDL